MILSVVSLAKSSSTTTTTTTTTTTSKKKTRYHALDTALINFIIKRKQRGKSVSRRMLKDEAMAIARSSNNNSLKCFKGSNGYFDNFICRNAATLQAIREASRAPKQASTVTDSHGHKNYGFHKTTESLEEPPDPEFERIKLNAYEEMEVFKTKCNVKQKLVEPSFVHQQEENYEEEVPIIAKSLVRPSDPEFERIERYANQEMERFNTDCFRYCSIHGTNCLVEPPRPEFERIEQNADREIAYNALNVKQEAVEFDEFVDCDSDRSFQVSQLLSEKIRQTNMEPSLAQQQLGEEEEEEEEEEEGKGPVITTREVYDMLDKLKNYSSQCAIQDKGYGSDLMNTIRQLESQIETHQSKKNFLNFISGFF